MGRLARATGFTSLWVKIKAAARPKLCAAFSSEPCVKIAHRKVARPQKVVRLI